MTPQTTPRIEPEAPEASLAQIAAGLSGQTDIAAALGAVENVVARLIPFVHCDICLMDRPGWVVSHEVGIRTRWSRASGRVDHAPVRELLLGQCEYMLTEDATRDPRYTYPGASCEPIINHNLRSRVNVPLVVMGTPIGTLNLSDTRIGIYDVETVAKAQQIANIMAPSFHILHLAERADRTGHAPETGRASEEGLRRGALELTKALEHERQRVGMDLHDQTLADLSRLLREVSAEPPLPLDTLASHLRDTITDLRRIIDESVPTLLDLFGFAHALRVHLERASGNVDMTLDVIDRTADAPDQLDPTVRSALFHITQEAINNATRHAGASRITVTVDHPAPQTLAVTVEDDGCGIPATPTRQSGLMHMRTRARLISAGLEVMANRGTTVRVTLRVQS